MFTFLREIGHVMHKSPTVKDIASVQAAARSAEVEALNAHRRSSDELRQSLRKLNSATAGQLRRISHDRRHKLSGT